MSIREVTVDELAMAMEAGATVVDVREPDEYVEAHVPGALLFPMSVLTEHVGELPAGDPLYVICRTGGRSLRVCQFLAEQGRTGVNVAGGTLAWLGSGRTVATGTEPS